MAKLTAAGLALVLFGGLLGWLLARQSEAPVWRTGVAHASVAGHVATFRAGATDYGFRGSVAWIDAAGSHHEGGWPVCLTDSARRVRFLTTAHPVESLGTPVLEVDCR